MDKQSCYVSKKNTLSFHDTLLTLDSDIISAIKDDKSPFDANQLNSSYTSLLQIACKRGYVEIVLWLIYAGADINYYHTKIKYTDEKKITDSEKPPLQHALENEHHFITQILLICNVKKYTRSFESEISLSEKKIDNDILSALLYWSIVNYHSLYKDYLFKLIQNNLEKKISHENKHADEIPLIDAAPENRQLKNLTSFAHFAAYKKNEILAINLYEKDEDKYSIHPYTPTLGYWAAKNQLVSLYEKISFDNHHVALTLEQLYQYSQNLFLTYLKKASPTQQALYHKYESEEKEDTLGLNPKQKKIFNLSKHGNEAALEIILDNVSFIDISKEIDPLIKRMLETTNLIMFDTLFHLFNKRDFFNLALEKHYRPLFILLMFANNLYEFELLKIIPFTNWNNYLNLLDETSAKGIMQRMLMQGCYPMYFDMRNNDEINIQKRFFDLQNISLPKFTQDYARSFSNTSSFKKNPNTAIIDSDLFYKHAHWFGFPMENKSTFSQKNINLVFHNTALMGYMGQFLDPKDNHLLSLTCHSLYENNRSLEIEKINDLLDSINQEIENLSYFEHRFSENRSLKIYFTLLLIGIIISLIGLIISAIFLHSTVNIISEYKNAPWTSELWDYCPYKQATDLGFYKFCWDLDVLNQKSVTYGGCDSFCSDRRQAVRDEIGEAFGVCSSSLSLLGLICGLVSMYCYNFEELVAGTERIDHVLLDSILSLPLQYKIHARIVESNLACTIHSPVKIVIDELKKLRHSASPLGSHSIFIRKPKKDWSSTALEEKSQRRSNSFELA